MAQRGALTSNCEPSWQHPPPVPPSLQAQPCTLRAEHRLWSVLMAAVATFMPAMTASAGSWTHAGRQSGQRNSENPM